MYVYVRANVGEELYVIRWTCLYKNGGINISIYNGSRWYLGAGGGMYVYACKGICVCTWVETRRVGYVCVYMYVCTRRKDGAFHVWLTPKRGDRHSPIKWGRAS